MIEGKDINDLVDRTELFIKHEEKKKFNMLKFILICIGLSLLLLWLTSCKKKEAKPAPAPKPYVAPEVMWLLGGDWKPTAHQYADTVFGPNLHIHKCCDGPSGTVVYYISYPVWKNATGITVPYYWNTDSLWLDNGIVGAGGKNALFVRIK